MSLTKEFRNLILSLIDWQLLKKKKSLPETMTWKILVPFMKKHSDQHYVSGPMKLPHFGKKDSKLIDKRYPLYLKRKIQQTLFSVSQSNIIFRTLSKKAYKNNWKIKNVKKLQRRLHKNLKNWIKKCLNRFYEGVTKLLAVTVKKSFGKGHHYFSYQLFMYLKYS